MKKTIVAAIGSLIVLFSAQLVYGQDLSKYRTFSFGMSLATVSKKVDLDANELQLIHQKPALIQELTWYPRQPFGTSRVAESVDKILFSFENGTLYRMLVTYDRSAIKGLTDEDMVQIISAKYGVATRPVADVNFPTNPLYNPTEKVIARWEDAEYSLNLFRSSATDTFAIVIFDKHLDSQAAASIAESVELERQEAPQKEVERAKKETDDLERQRQKNIEVLRP
jgi:hypothetical protein